jgi:mRNA-binding protein PUF3
VAVGLQVDVNSAAPTPVLTMEPNTPQSSSPPSTNASAADDIVDETAASDLKSGSTESTEMCPEVRVDEA